jgi:hypothetical protein
MALACAPFGVAAQPGARVKKAPTPDPEAPLGALFQDPDAAAPQAMAYSAQDGAVRFVLDRSQPRFVLLKYANEPEVWALRPNWGPRGDEFLRNDIGEVIVRVNALGGITLYGPLGPTGAPAAREGRARPLPSPPAAGRRLQSIVEDALVGFERVLNSSIRVEAAAGLPPTLVQDALERAAQAMRQVPRGWFGLPRRRVRRVRVERAPVPAVSWSRGVLLIGVTPGLGHAGRPSSAAVRAALVAQD